MRKRIGLLLGECDNEYAMEFIPYVFEEAKRFDYDVVVFGNYGAYDQNLSLYSDGEKSVYKIPDYSTFDGFIVEESRFNIQGMEKDLFRYISKNCDVPVVYLKAKKDKFNSVIASDKDAIKGITEHFIKVHKFTNICHMAGRRDLQDALDRMQGYLEAMEEAQLKVSNHMVYWGDYWYNKGAEALDYFLDGKDEYPEAIVCANDYMAIAVIRELKKRGIRVPEDVCVSGYDNTEDGRLLDIPLTTVETPINEMAVLAVNMIYNLNKGKEFPRVQYTSDRMKLILRDSCGCEKFDGARNLEHKIKMLEQQKYGMDMFASLENGYHIAFEEDEIYQTADGHFKYTRANTGYLCLCEDAFRSNDRPIDMVNEYTDDMVLKRVFHNGVGVRYGSPDTPFKRSELLPGEIFETKEPQLYFVYPLHSLNMCYGYMVFNYSDDNWVNKFTQFYTMELGEAIENYNIRSGYMDLEDMKKMYLMDELTGLSNRRGYEQNLQILLDRARRRGLNLTLVSVDMDGLKYINDNYGHSEGDFGLKKIAEALRSCLNEKNGETASRHGGDEFAAVLISSDKRRYLKFEADFADALQIANEKANRPYDIHASMGLFVVENLYDNIQSCIERADERMYNNKLKYKETHADYVR